MRQARPFIGITIIGYFLVLSSSAKMMYLIDVSHYHYIHQDLPSWLIPIRYGVSWILKIVGLAAGVGILYRKDLFRKFAVLLWAFILVTVPFKHSYAGFVKHAQFLEGLITHHPVFSVWAAGIPQGTFLNMTSTAVIVVRAADILIAAVLIFYLTRPKVKAQFR